jgi:vacuolar protein sorting-associated protein 51
MAVKYYSKARKTLDRYKQMSTFKSIEDDCQAIIKDLKLKLYERIDSSSDNSSESIFESVNLLHQLDEPMENLCSKYIERVEKCLDADLSILVLNIDMISSTKRRTSKEDTEETTTNNQIAMDILEFVDHGCNNFLANLSSIIQSYNSIFIENNIST